MNKTHKFAWSSWSITRRLSPSGRIYCVVLKRTRWWGRRCFQPWGFQDFLRGWEERSRAADVLSCSAAPKANLRCSQSGLTTNWRWLCKDWLHGSELCRFPLFTDPGGLATAADLKWGVKWSLGRSGPRVRWGWNRMTSEIQRPRV